jgi:hypothetical protein
MRLGALVLFASGLAVMSLLDGIGAALVAALLCGAGALRVTTRQLAELAAEENETPQVRVRVVRWNY